MSRKMVTLFSALPVTALVVAVATSIWFQEEPAASQQQYLTNDELVELAVQEPLPAMQQQILADGMISLEEYNGAVEQVMSCVEDGGLRVNRLGGTGVGGALQFEVEGDPRILSPDATTELHMGCWETFVGDLGMIWASQNRPTAAQIADREAAFDICVAANGFPEFAGDRGDLAAPGRLEPNSRGQWVYFGCIEGGADWKLPAPQ